MSGTEGRSNATFQSSSPTTMGVANKMSADERSQQVVVSVSKLEREVGRKSSAQEDEDEPSQPPDVETGKSEFHQILSTDDQVLDRAKDDECLENRIEASLGSMSETKRKRGRPKKQLDSVVPPPEEFGKPLNDADTNVSDVMDVSEKVPADPTPKRVRTKPKRFAPDDLETPKGSDSVPSKRKRGRPPKNETNVNPICGVADSPAVDAFKDPLEEDLSESSSDVVVDRWINPDLAKANTARDNASPAPSSSASSSIESSADSPLRLGSLMSHQKRQRGRPKITNIVTEKASPATVSNIQVRFLCV